MDGKETVEQPTTRSFHVMALWPLVVSMFPSLSYSSLFHARTYAEQIEKSHQIDYRLPITPSLANNQRRGLTRLT